MKTAVSIPDAVFKRVERLARHAPDEVTEAMDRVCGAVGGEPDVFVASAGRRVLENTEW